MKKYYAVAYSRMSEWLVADIGKAVFHVQRISLEAARDIAELWAKIGYYSVVYSTDGAIDQIETHIRFAPQLERPIAIHPDYYIDTSFGTVSYPSEAYTGTHVVVVNKTTNDICAFTGLASDPESWEHACLFAAAPRLYNALKGMLAAFGDDFQPGENATVDQARWAMNCVHRSDELKF